MTIQETLDAPGGAGTTYAITTSEDFHGVLSSDYDEDWIRAQLDANYGYVFRVTGDGTATSISEAYLTLRNPNGDQIATHNSSNSTAIVYTTTISSGTYFAQVGYDGSRYYGEAGSYNVELIREIATGLGTRETLLVDEIQNSTLEHNYDEDWFRMELEANYGYVVKLTGDGSATSISEAYLVLNQANGDQVAYSNSSSATAIVSTTTTSAGTYYAQVGYDNAGYYGEAGSYNVELIREIATGLGTRESLDVGEVQNSTIEYSKDEDWFRMELEANYGYVVKLTGDGSATSVSETYLALKQTNGDQISYSDTDSASALVSLTTTSAGTYYAQVGDDSYRNNGGAGSYNIELIREIASGIGTRESLTMGETENSTIEHSRDSDWFAVELKRGETYTFRLTSDGAATGITSAALGVHSQNGDELTYSSTNDASATIYYEATYTGVHYLRAGNAASSYSGGPGTYDISAYSDMPDSYDSSADGTVGNFTRSAVDFEDDLDGFSYNLRGGQTYDVFVSGAGLQDGVSKARAEYWDYGSTPESILSSRSDTMMESFTATYDDEFHFFVGNSAGDQRGTGSYSFAVLESWSGNDEANVLRGSGSAESIHGLGGNDQINGRGGKDILSGESGRDKLNGGGGSDYLFGGGGNDKLVGGRGADILVGGSGKDTLSGGRGDDVFVFANSSGKDVVKDFNAGSSREKIDLSAVSKIVSYNDLVNNHLSQSDDDAVISAGKRFSVTLTDTDISDLDPGDFIF